MFFIFQIYVTYLPREVSGHFSAKDLTVSKNNIMEIHIFPYLENNLKVILLSI